MYMCNSTVYMYWYELQYSTMYIAWTCTCTCTVHVLYMYMYMYMYML